MDPIMQYVALGISGFLAFLIIYILGELVLERRMMPVARGLLSIVGFFVLWPLLYYLGKFLGTYFS